MACTEIVQHKGKSIVLVNLSNCSPQSTFTILDEAADGCDREKCTKKCFDLNRFN